MSRTRFKVNPSSIIAWMSRSSLIEAGATSEVSVTATGLEPRTTEFVNEHWTIWPNWANNTAAFWVLICTVNLNVCSFHVKYVFQSEYTLYSCLNFKELFTRNRSRLIYELKGSRFESRCSHLNFKFHAWFEQRVSWHSGNYRVWVLSETRTWHDKNIQWNLYCCNVYVFEDYLVVSHLLFYCFHWLLFFVVEYKVFF